MLTTGDHLDGLWFRPLSLHAGIDGATIDAEERMPFLNLLFWAFFASYVVHILDETLLNGGFVQWIAENFWPQYLVRTVLFPRLTERHGVTHN